MKFSSNIHILLLRRANNSGSHSKPYLIILFFLSSLYDIWESWTDIWLVYNVQQNLLLNVLDHAFPPSIKVDFLWIKTVFYMCSFIINLLFIMLVIFFFNCLCVQLNRLLADRTISLRIIWKKKKNVKIGITWRQQYCQIFYTWIFIFRWWKKKHQQIKDDIVLLHLVKKWVQHSWYSSGVFL